MISNESLYLFLVSSSIQGIVLSVGIFKKNERLFQSKHFALSILFFSIYLFESAFVTIKLWPKPLSLITYPTLYLLGPLLYYSIESNDRSLGNSKFKLLKYLLFFYALFTPYYLGNIFNLFDNELRDSSDWFYQYLRTISIFLSSTTYAIYSFIFGLISLFKLIKLKRNSPIEHNWKFIFTLLFITYYFLSIGLDLISLIAENHPVYLNNGLRNLILAIIIQAFGYFLILKPSKIQEATKKLIKKKNQTQIPLSTRHKIQLKMVEFFDEKLFLDEEFDLQALSVLLEVNKNIASRFINEEYDQNFNRFINQQRIKYAIELWNTMENNSARVKDLVFKSGFQNSVSFYRAFKDITGIPFSEFKKSRNSITNYNL